MPYTMNLSAVSDDELLRRLSEILHQVRRDEADLITHIAEVEARKLYAREAVPSMFAYCTEILRLGENEAYYRITAARASREHPMLLTMLREGQLNLSGIALLARHLTDENRDEVLKRAAGKTHRQLKELVAELAPRPDVRTTVRKLPARRAEGPAPGSGQLGTFRVESSVLNSEWARAAARGEGTLADADPSGERPEGLGQTSPITAAGGSDQDPTPVVLGSRAPQPPAPRLAVVEPLSPARYKVAFTADQELRDMLERLQALMRSSVPDGDLAAVLKIAVKEKLERLEARRFAKTKNPRKSLAEADTRPKSRHIPAPVRRAVHQRDGGRCTYRDKQGRRCSETRHLEFHHRVPFGQGGEHRPENLTLHCRTHNNLVAEIDFGEEVMARHRGSASSSPSRTPSLPVSRRRGHG